MHPIEGPTITLTFITPNFTILFRMSAYTWVLLYTLFVTSIASQQTYLHRFNYGILFNKQFDIVSSMSKWQHTFAIHLKEFEVPFNISFSDLCIGKLAQQYNAQCCFY